jgi:hypothetical protein
MAKITHWTQCLPEAGKQIDMQVGYINGKVAEINNLLAMIERLDSERVQAETKLLEEVDQHYSETEIKHAKGKWFEMQEKALVNESKKEVQGA